jgi:plasmid stabilization system protein ParE
VKRSFRYSPRAQSEIRKAVCWYDSERKGLGSRLLKAVEAQVRRITKQPDRWPLVDENVRQSPIPEWDYYSILYEVLPDHINVISVFHASREPKDS